MSTLAQTFPTPSRTSLAMPTAALEILSLLGFVALSALCFLMGWLTPNGAAVLTALVLVTLVALSWSRLGQGRHPCFLFLSMLLLLQGGRLLTYCLGSEPDPLRIRVLAYFPFDLTRDQAGLVLLSLALSAICIYAPCRWNFRRIAPPDTSKVRHYLPYLYLLFYGSLPVQLFKNYSYYQYAQDHGGYIYFWVNHGDFAASVPLWVRLVSLISLPAFIGIFVFESRKKYLYLATACYFASSLLMLLLGTRMATFGLILSLWYVAGIKSGKKSRLIAVLLLGTTLVLAGEVFQALREDSDSIKGYTLDPLKFVTLQGNSLDVTEVVVKYQKIFSPYAGSYLRNELQNAFVPHDFQHYFRGRGLDADVSVLLNPGAYAQGYGTAGSYLADEYMIGGLAGVVLISLLIGGGLHLLYRFSRKAFSLAIVVIILPDIIGMPRGDLLDWASVLVRTSLFLAMLAFGWLIYSTVIWLMRAPRTGSALPQPAGIA